MSKKDITDLVSLPMDAMGALLGQRRKKRRHLFSKKNNLAKWLGPATKIMGFMLGQGRGKVFRLVPKKLKLRIYIVHKQGSHRLPENPLAAALRAGLNSAPPARPEEQ